jgi:signal transduction histidine kinase
MSAWQYVAALAVGAPGLVLGALLLSRRQWVVGALLLVLGVLPLALLAPDPELGGRPPEGLGLALAVASVAGWVWFYLPPALLAASLPDGRLGRGWWMLLAGWVLFLVSFHVAVALDPGTYGPGENQIPGHPPVAVPAWVDGLLGVGSLLLLLVLLVGSAARLLVRFRRGPTRVRRQLKWFLLSMLLLPAVLVVTWVTYLLTDAAGTVVVAGLLLVYLTVPVAVAIGVLRHDLLDVDALVSRAVAYLLLTGGLVGLFAALTVGLGVGLGRGSELGVALATLACALVFGLLRQRVQWLVDATFDKARHDALIGLDRFLDGIREGRDEPEEVEAALRVALRDPAITVAYWMGSEGTAPWLRGVGTPAERPDGLALDVAVAGRLIGRIGYDAASERPGLLREALRRVHLPLELARSRIALRQALAETRASRTRLVEATDAERRRLERDLHDGAQQRLVAIGMSLRLAQERAGRDDPMRSVLESAVRELQGAVSELRALAGGVRPHGLDEGLPAAIRGLVRASPVPVDARVTGERVPEHVATTAYYVAAEALTNALKHAGARAVGIDVAFDEGELVVRVCDDGCGGATVSAGSGLAGLEDRVAATGGVLHVDNDPGTGTRVEARLPCGS